MKMGKQQFNNPQQSPSPLPPFAPSTHLFPSRLVHRTDMISISTSNELYNHRKELVSTKRSHSPQPSTVQIDTAITDRREPTMSDCWYKTIHCYTRMHRHHWKCTCQQWKHIWDYNNDFNPTDAPRSVKGRMVPLRNLYLPTSYEDQPASRKRQFKLLLGLSRHRKCLFYCCCRSETPSPRKFCISR